MWYRCLMVWHSGRLRHPNSPVSVHGNSGHPSSCTSNPKNTLHCLLLGDRNLKGLHQIYVAGWEHLYTSVCIVYVHHEPQQLGSTRFSIAILY